MTPRRPAAKSRPAPDLRDPAVRAAYGLPAAERRIDLTDPATRRRFAPFLDEIDRLAGELRVAKAEAEAAFALKPTPDPVSPETRLLEDVRTVCERLDGLTSAEGMHHAYTFAWLLTASLDAERYRTTAPGLLADMRDRVPVSRGRALEVASEPERTLIADLDAVARRIGENAPLSAPATAYLQALLRQAMASLVWRIDAESARVRGEAVRDPYQQVAA